MNNLVLLLIILATTDLFLTLLWTWRWNSQKCIRMFHKKVPFELIEANPIIRHSVNSFGLYAGIIFGYFFTFLIQLGLSSLHFSIGIIVCIILLWAISGHLINNKNTSNKHIIKMTVAYNRKFLDKKKNE